jgi:hypothetical protein
MKIGIEPIALVERQQTNLKLDRFGNLRIVSLLRARLSTYRKGTSNQFFKRVALLLVTMVIGWSIIVSPAEAQTPVNVLERGYTPLRTGANTAETALTPVKVRSTANQFHRRFAMPVRLRV